MDGLEAASLRIKLKYLAEWNQRRKEIARRYHTSIKNPKIKMQVQPAGHDSVFHLFVITTENRDGLMGYLNGHHIFPGLHYPVPCHLQKAYKGLGYKEGDFTNSEYLAAHCLSLPMYAELSDEDVEYVIKTLNNY
jgi:dTDP-4-amino-4,6-dideoxygalactose transaminase